METQWLPVSLVVWITALAGTLDARQQVRFVALCTGLLFARGRRTVASWLRLCARGATTSAITTCSAASDARPWRSPGSCSASSLSGSRAMGRARRWSSPSTTRPPSGTGRTSRARGKHHNPTPGPAGSPFLYGHVWVCLARLVRHSLWGAIALPILSHLYIRAKDVGWMAAYYGWQFHTKLELAAAQIEWLVQQLGPDHPPIWVVTDGAYVKRPFLKRVLGAGVTVISRLRCDAALWSLPVVVDPGQKKGRGRPPKYGKDRIDLARRAAQNPGLADRAFLPLRPAGGEEVQDVPGDLQTGGWGDPCGAGARARSLGGVLLDRPGSERGIDPRDGGRPLGVGAGLPRRQGGSWSGTATIAPCVGQRGGVEPDRLVAHAGGAVGLGPAAVPGSRDRSDSPWDKPERRPSHANRCQELRREALQEEYSSLPSVGGLHRKIRRFIQRSCAESHEADSSGKVQFFA